MNLSMILATTANGGIGLNDALPWGHIAEDMAWFRQHTLHKVIVVGRRTWDSLPKRPLVTRTNVVISFNNVPDADFTVTPILKDPAVTVQRLVAIAAGKEIMVIGGAAVYNVLWPFVNKVYHTRIKQDYQCDTFFEMSDKRLQGWDQQTVGDSELCSFHIYTKPTDTASP